MGEIFFMKKIVMYYDTKFVNKDIDKYLYDLMHISNGVYITKGIYQGKHFAVNGFSNFYDLSSIVETLENYCKITNEVSYFGFIKKYKLVLDMEKNSFTEENFFQNISYIEMDNKNEKFQNNAQYEMYTEISNFFDKYLCMHYFKRNDIKWLIKLFYEVSLNIETFVYRGQDNILRIDGGVSHFSHYKGYLSLFLDDKIETINREFCSLYYEGSYDGLIDVSPNSNLVSFNDKIRKKIIKLISENKIDYFSPLRYNINTISSLKSHIHYLTFSDPEMLLYIKNNVELILSRWILNVLYEKLPLLGFTIKDKMFINYCIAKMYGYIEEE